MVITKVRSIFRLPDVFLRIIEWKYISKSASARASFWSVNEPKASQDKQNIRDKRFLPSKPFFANILLILEALGAMTDQNEALVDALLLVIVSFNKS